MNAAPAVPSSGSPGAPASADTTTDTLVLVPAYQAGDTVGDVVGRLAAACPGLPILVVDDGSDDDTGERAAAAGAEVIRHAENRGKGAALRTGFLAARERGVDRVATVDADGQHLPEELPGLLAAHPDADLVLGVRGAHYGEMSPVRRWSNRISSRLIGIAAGRRLTDVQTGFRVYHRRLLETVPLLETGFDLESAVVVRACRRGLRVESADVELARADGRAGSHWRPLADSARIARAVVRAMLEEPRT